ncbi:N-acetylneuraminate synthase family protein [Aurantivibrio plasticivorans]
MPAFNIASRRIGPDEPPLVIAEIGINHGGSLSVAKEMVDAAVAAGCEIVKHQTHIIEDEMAAAAKQIQPDNADQSIYSLMDECALNEEDEAELKRYTESKGAIFISTPFSRAAVERLERLDVPAYKIGSGECNNYPLVEHIARKGKPVILSTGMNDIESIQKSVNILRQYEVPYALLHCTNIYPTPPELVRLGAIQELAEAFPDATVGLSDHTISNSTCIAAVALGADILERHFTDSMDRVGPDIICSMDPKALKELIIEADIVRKARGGRKDLLTEEQGTRDFAFASVVSTKAIDEGEVFTEDNLWVKRPGTGEIKAEDYHALIGCRASRKIEADELLRRSDVSPQG